MSAASIGVSGRGSRLLAELLRGHRIAGIARNTRNVVAHPKLTPRHADANRPEQPTPVLKRHDAGLGPMKFATMDAEARLPADANGRSWVSMQDHAVAFVDGLELPEHLRQRFTAGY